MSRSRVVASQPARASVASSLSLAAATLSRLLTPACPALLACMSAPEVGLSVARISPLVPRPSPRRWEFAVRLRCRPPNRTCRGEDTRAPSS